MTGIDNESVDERIRKYGDNKINEMKWQSFLMMVLEASQDMLLLVLLVLGFVILVLNTIFEDDRATAWIDGFIIIVSVIIIVIITAWSDYQKQEKF